MTTILIILGLLLTPASLSAQPDSAWSMRFGIDGYDLQWHQAFCLERESGDMVFVRELPIYNGSRSYLTRVRSDGFLVSNDLIPGDQRMYNIQSIIQTKQGDFAFIGGSPQVDFMCEILLMRMDLDGNLVDMTLFHNPQSDHGLTLLQTNDYAYAMAGYIGRHHDGSQEADMWFIRADSTGDSTSSNTYGSSEDYEQCWAITEGENGGYLLAGTTNSKSYIVRTEADGAARWIRYIGDSLLCQTYSATRAFGKGYVIAGMKESSDGELDTLLLRNDSQGWAALLDDEGQIVWEFEAGGSYDDQFNSVIKSRDGNLVLAGQRMSDDGFSCGYWLVKIDMEGELIWSKTYFEEGWKAANAVLQLDDGSFALIGNGDAPEGVVGSIILLKTEPDDDGFESVPPDFVSPAPEVISLAGPFPNPFNSTTTFTFSLPTPSEFRVSMHDLTGRLIESLETGFGESGEHRVVWTPHSVGGGLYFIRLETGGETVTRKALYVK
jgi:hypothetical protein